MKGFNLEKERNILLGISKNASEINAESNVISRNALAKNEEEWDKADEAAKPIRKDMIKELNEDIELLKAAVKALKKSSTSFSLSDLTTNLKGVAKNITKIENQGKKSLSYNGFLEDNVKSIKVAAKYPSQYDAEFLADLTNNLNNVYTGGSSMGSRMIDQINQIRLSKWDEVFGDKSPWASVRSKKKGKVLEVKWDKEKAKKLDLEA